MTLESIFFLVIYQASLSREQPCGVRNLLQRRLADIKQRGKGVEIEPVGGGRRGVVALPRAEVLILQRRVLVALDG